LQSDVVENEYLFISHSIKAVLLWAHSKEFANANACIFFLCKVLNPENVSIRKNQMKSIEGLLERVENKDKIEQFDELYNFVSRLKIKG
jgi:hypothetical protein